MNRRVRARVRLAAISLGAVLVVPLGAGAAAATGDLFLPYVAISLPAAPDAVAVGDVTGDGRDDVVATTGSDSDPADEFQLFVLAQGPDGLLQPPVRYDTAGTYPDRPGSVDIGDIDGDGRPDVAVAIDGVGIEVFPGLPDGTLGAPTLSPHPNSTFLRIGQLDGRGGLDVAAIGWNSDTVTVFTDPGGGLDGIATYPAIHNGWDDLEIGDVNGDGHQDLVVMSGQGFGPNVSIVPGRGDGTFGPTIEQSVYEQVNTHGIGVGDTDGDGRTDIAASYGGNSPSSRMALWVQLAGGSLDLPVIHNSYDIPEPVEMADLDRDGQDDVVTLHGGWLQAGVYLGRQSGTLADEQLFPIPYASHYSPHGLAIGDVNGDGWPDIVAADSNNGLVILSNSQVFQPTEPGAPTLTSAVGGDGQVTLGWAPPDGDGGSAVTSYLVEAEPGGSYCFVSALQCTIAGLTNGTTYMFTVRAGNEVGLGPESNALSAMPGVAPSAPRSPAVSPNLAAGVGLAWQPPASLGDPELHGYRIYRGTPGGTLSLRATVNSNASSFTDTAVVNGAAYAYQVAAFNAFGEGPRTTVVTAQRGTAPGAPRSPVASSGPKGITLTWTAPASNGGSTVTAYKIYRGTASGTESFLVSVGGSTFTYLDKAVAKKTKYFYWIGAENVLGEGPHSSEVSATAR
jgi:hypothetical protein